MLICAALSCGTSTIASLLNSDDISLTMAALANMGAGIDKQIGDTYQITGFGGYPKPCESSIYLGNSGTSMRLLAGIAALGKTPYTLTGDARMCERPMQELLDALQMLNIRADASGHQGTPPVIIQGGDRNGGRVQIDCSKSSQYLSALLMMGAFMKNGLDIELDAPPVSAPYINLTLDIMKQFNVAAEKKDATHYRVDGDQRYYPGVFSVEPDLSNAGYFWAIGAITGTMIHVKNISKNSLQGDLKQVDILEKMGCRIAVTENTIGVCGERLHGIDVDMSDTPDAVPAIAVVAAFARGKTRITNIHHLREKECDRIDALFSQLKKMGVAVEQGSDYLWITGGHPRGAMIETFNDHRIAMAFSIPGLIIPGMEIENESCVEKSFPNYWDLFDAL